MCFGQAVSCDQVKPFPSMLFMQRCDNNICGKVAKVKRGPIVSSTLGHIAYELETVWSIFWQLLFGVSFRDSQRASFT